MNERLKQIREYYKLSTRSFAERVGMSNGAISLLENGRRTMTPQFIKLVCREFGINENWLLSGEGEMLLAKEQDKELAEITAELYQQDLSPKDLAFLLKLLKLVSKMTPEQRYLLIEASKHLADENDEQ